MMGAFKILAQMKKLRGTWLDPFGWQSERKLERTLIAEYEALLAEIRQRLSRETYQTAVELAATPEAIRGFGIVKSEAAGKARARQAQLIAAMCAPAPAPAPAAHKQAAE
jgi:indolepyruvate ferredoxin oxidoreductase